LSCLEETAPDGQAEDREPAEASDEEALVAGEWVCHNCGHRVAHQIGTPCSMCDVHIADRRWEGEPNPF
jgi:rubrerythrin